VVSYEEDALMKRRRRIILEEIEEAYGIRKRADATAEEKRGQNLMLNWVETRPAHHP